ncbi:MAG: DUF5657 family protein [Microgenomates group bacterium]
MTMFQFVGIIDPLTFDIGTIDLGIQLLVKVMLLIAMFFYLVFAIVIIRQIYLMKRTVMTPFSPTVTILGHLHLLLALVVAAYYLILL